MGRWRVTRVAVWAVVIGCCALYLVGNGRVALWDRDEPRYALASRWMARTGDWVVPRFGWGRDPTEPRTAKPAGIYWLEAGAMKALGESEFAARFPSAAATTILLAGLAAIVSRRAGLARAFWVVLILGTSAMLVVASKMCVTDGVLLLFVTAGHGCLLAMYRGNRSPWVAAGFWTAVAAGGHVKGPVVLGIYGMTLASLALLDRVRTKGQGTQRMGQAVAWMRSLRPVLGVLILAVLVGPWLLIVERRSPGFLGAAIGHDVIERMRTGLEEHTGPPGFYLATLFGTFFPWSLLLPLTVGITWKRWKLRKDLRYAVAAVVGPLVLMELVRTKLVHYVLPIFPPLAWLVAEAILRCLRGRDDGLVNRVARSGVPVWAAVVGLIALLPCAYVISIKGTPGLGGALAMALAGVVMALAVGISFRIRRPAQGLVAMGVGFALFCACAFGWMLPDATFMRLPVAVGGALRERGATRTGDVLMMGYKERSVAWYQGGTIDEEGADHLRKSPRETWPTWVVLDRRVLEGGWKPEDQWGQDEKRSYDVVQQFRGLNYAGGGWVDVVIMKKKEGTVDATTQASPRLNP